MDQTGLVRYDAMVHAIAECHTVDEVKDIRDKARALEVYAKQAMNMEAERKATEIRIRAERKAGDMLSKMDKVKNQHEKCPSDDTRGTLSGMGISYDQSSNWQKLAAVPDDQFEEHLADPKPSTNGIIRRAEAKANGEPGPMDKRALRIWGRLRDFERDGPNSLLNADPDFVLGEMTPAMRADLRRILGPAILLLQALQEKL